MLRHSRLLLILGFVIVAAVCARLGFWQLSRLQERRAVNARTLTARSAPVAALGGSARDGRLVNRRVRVTGRYDHTHDIVIRARPYRGVPGVELVSPLLL